MESNATKESNSINRAYLDKRNTELGSLMRYARETKNLTQDACAQYLGTSRQRYAKLEAGAIPIPMAEYEAILLYLEIPLSDIWPKPLDADSVAYVLPVTLEPGQIGIVILRTN